MVWVVIIDQKQKSMETRFGQCQILQVVRLCTAGTSLRATGLCWLTHQPISIWGVVLNFFSLMYEMSRKQLRFKTHWSSPKQNKKSWKHLDQFSTCLYGSWPQRPNNVAYTWRRNKNSCNDQVLILRICHKFLGPRRYCCTDLVPELIYVGSSGWQYELVSEFLKLKGYLVHIVL